MEVTMLFFSKLRHRNKYSPVVKTPAVIQRQVSECGVASLTMILRHYGCHVSLEEVGRIMGVSRDGTDILQMRDTARHFGLNARVLKWRLETLHRLKCPFIVHMGFIHMVVVEGIDEDHVYINDPVCGPRKLEVHDFAENYTGVAIDFEPGPEFKITDCPPNPVVRVLKAIAPVKKEMIASSIMFLIISGLMIAIALQAGSFIDRALTGGRIYSQNGLILKILSAVAGIFGCLVIVNRNMTRAQAVLNGIISKRIFSHLMKLSNTYFNYRDPTAIYRDIMAGPQAVDAMTGEFGLVLLKILWSPVLALVLIWISPIAGLTGVFICCISLAALCYLYFNRTSPWRKVRYSANLPAGFSVMQLYNMESYRVGGKEKETFAGLTGMQAVKLTAEQEFGAVNVYASAFSENSGVLGTAFILMWAGIAYQTGEITIGNITAALILMIALIAPFSQLLKQGNQFQLVMENLDQVTETIGLPEQYDPENPPTIQYTDEANIILENIVFGYAPKAPPLIDSVSIKIPERSQIGIFGPQGCGKTSLAKVICGLCDARQGRVLFPESRQVEKSRNTSNCIAALVETYPVMFEGTVRENIRLWDPKISDEQVINALKDACIWDEVRYRGGPDAVVKRGGENFSGGQKRRLAVARALVRRPVLIVLDETFEGLEWVLEQSIRLNLRRSGYTVLMIGHRHQSLQACDQVLEMKDGSLMSVPPDFDYSVKNDWTNHDDGPKKVVPDSWKDIKSETVDDSIMTVVRQMRDFMKIQGPERRTAISSERIPPGWDLLREAAAANGFFLRKVRFNRPGWWQKDHGPLITYFKEDHRPVALFPVKGTQYRMMDPLKHEQVPVTSSIASLLEEYAFMPYPVPEETVTDFRKVFIKSLKSAGKDSFISPAAGTAEVMMRFAFALLWIWALYGIFVPGDQPSGGWFIFILIIVLSGMIGFYISGRTAALRMEGKIELACQAEFWGRIIRIPVNFFRKGSLSEIAGWAKGAGPSFKQIGKLPESVWIGSFTVVTAICLSSRINTALAFAGGVLLLIGVMGASVLTWSAANIEKAAFPLRSRNSDFLWRFIIGFTGFRAIGVHHYPAEIWENSYEKEMDTACRKAKVNRWIQIFNDMHPWIAVSVFVCLGHEVVWYELIGCGVISGVALRPVRRLATALSTGIMSRVLIKRIRPILVTPLEIRPDYTDIGKPTGAMEIRNVSYTYRGSEKPALRNVSMQVAAGKITAVAGASGSGKSTLLRLMLGFDTPSTGEIFYDGHSLSRIDQSSLRRWIGAVFQDELLGNRTIRAHIAGMSPYPLDKVWEAIRMVDMEEEIRKKIMGIQSIVNSDGMSTGQVQRIQLASAVIRRPQILFLDEATSGIDPRTQQRLFTVIRELNITCIIITHRTDILAMADHIAVLDRGRLVQSGSFDELSRENGHIRTLYY